MNIYFFGYVVPNINHKDNDAISPIGNNMQLGMLEEWGKILKGNLKVYTFYPIPPYKKSNVFWMKRKTINLREETSTKVLPFINISLIKQICIMFATFFYLFKDIRMDQKKDNVVITYHVSLFYSIPVILLSKVLKFKSVCLISDAPIDFIKRKNRFVDSVRVISNFFREKLIKKYDAYLTINEYIINEFKINKPYIPIYVGADTVQGRTENKNEVLKNPIKITYTGALEKHYNIHKVIEAMSILGGKYELHLYGKGSLAEEIDFNKFPNVKYHGFVDNNEVKKKQSDSDVLICLLSEDSYLGKYAFPGKIFEYLLSGVPIISCNTPSIFKELNPFLNFIDNETPIDIAESIIEITSTPNKYELYRIKADKGKNFVVKNCNWKSQVKRINGFIEELIHYN